LIVDAYVDMAEHIEPASQSMPENLQMAVGGLFIPEARETVERLYEFERPFAADTSHFERAFGMRATPMQEAIRRIIARYREHTK